MELKRYLDDIESRIDPAQEDSIAAQWKNFCDLKCTDDFFSPHRALLRPSSIEWPSILINAAFDDIDLMIYSQLCGVSSILSSGSGLMLSVRANYGTGIMPSIFGGEMFFLTDSANTLPSTKPLAGGVDALRAIVDEHDMDYSRGLAPRVFEFAARWHELTRDYPLISRYVNLYNPDLQGPFAIVDMLLGSQLYYLLYDEPELVHDAVSFMADNYLNFTARWHAVCPPYSPEYSIEWGLMHPGLTMLRNDAIVNLSDGMYREFAMPYDERVFSVLGGCMHFCGRGDHYMASACSVKGISSINMSQPELNDMNKIYAATIERGKLIVGMPEHEILRAREAGKSLLGRVQSGAAASLHNKRE